MSVEKTRSATHKQSRYPSNKHITGDARTILHWGWDLLMVAHPPCTRLCLSGVRWLHEPPTKLSTAHYSIREVAAYARMNREQRLAFMWDELDKAADLFSAFWNADMEHGIPRICIENPVMHGHAKQRIRNYEEFAQSVQPWQFGHGECKRTCFWLKGLPKLEPTNIVAGRAQRIHQLGPSADRWRERSKFFPGFASAMAEQWGTHALQQLAA
ncbi:hypothetical protein [Bradyrhizobium manausense]